MDLNIPSLLDQRFERPGCIIDPLIFHIWGLLNKNHSRVFQTITQSFLKVVRLG